jgi:hypothetical protein
MLIKKEDQKLLNLLLEKQKKVNHMEFFNEFDYKILKYSIIYYIIIISFIFVEYLLFCKI